MDIRKVRLKSICFRIFWAMSGGAFTSLCMLRGSYYELILCVLISMVLCGYYILPFKADLLKSLVRMKWSLKSLYALTAITIAYHNISLCYESQNLYYLLTKISMERLYTVLFLATSILSIPMFFLFVLYGFHLIGDSIRKVFIDYKRFFFFAGMISIVIILIYLFFTDIFFTGYNAIYSMDSSRYIETNVYINFTAGENDIRQPFFGIASSLIFALPNFISSFIPGIYPYLIGIANAFLIVTGIVLLMDMMELEDNRGIAFAFYVVLYPVILFFFVIEQYAIVFFFMMIFLRQIYSGKRNAFVYALNAGTLVISGAWLPLMGSESAVAVSAVIGIAIVFGRFSLFIHSIDSIQELLRFSGKEAGLSMMENLKQYFNFVANCFIKTETSILKMGDSDAYVLSGEGIYWIAGIFIFVLCIVSFVINRKKYVCRISMYWLFIGFIVMAVIGWGTVENNLVLYSLYFGWPFAVLIFELIKKKLQIPIVRICTIISIICIGLYNIWGFTDILRFGRTFL